MDKTAILVRFGKNVESLRKEKMMTPYQLAEAISQSLEFVEQIEAGKIEVTLLDMIDLSEAFGIPLPELSLGI